MTTLDDQLTTSLRARFPLGGTPQLTLDDARFEVASLAPPGVAPILAIRRGVTYSAQYAMTFSWRTSGGAAHEQVQSFDLPMRTPEGWFVIDGATYDAAAVTAHIASILPGYLDVCVASTREHAPRTLDAQFPPQVFFDARFADQVFAPWGQYPVLARRQPARSTIAGRAIPLSAGVLVWPQSGEPREAQIELALDHEVPRHGIVRPGDVLFGEALRAAVALDAREPIELLAGVGQRIEAGSRLAIGDGRDLVATVTGTIVCIERHALPAIDQPWQHEPHVPEIAEIRDAAREALRADVMRSLAGQRAVRPIVDDHGRCLVARGDVIPPSMSLSLGGLAAVLDDFPGLCPDVAARADTVERLAAGSISRMGWLRPGVRHRVRYIVDQA